MRLVKVYKELSRALATVGRAKLVLSLQLSAVCFERRSKKKKTGGKYKVTV